MSDAPAGIPARDQQPDHGRQALSQALVVRLPNWVGDVCMALPTLARLAACGFRLHCFGKGWASDLLAGFPYAVKRLPTGVRAIAAAMRATGARRGVLLTNSFSSALHLRWAGIQAIGYAQEFRSPLLTVAVERVRGEHEVEAFWRLAQVCAHQGPDGRSVRFTRAEKLAEPPPPGLGLVLSDDHRRAATAALAQRGVRGSYTVLCPLAVGLVDGRSKQWPSFPLLARGLGEHGQTLIACPGPGEEAACAEALPGATLLPGLGLGAYAAVLAGAQRVVANDSGPLHLAAAVGAPVLGIFGVSDPARTHPWDGRGRTVGDVRGWPTVQAVLDCLMQLPAPADPVGGGLTR